MSMKCFDLLDIPNLETLELVAGDKGLSNQIYWVHVAEAASNVDELFAWLKPGDFLIVVGPFLQGDPNLLYEVASRAIQTRLSGLLVYESACCGHLPEQVIRLADEHDLPTFLIHGRATSSLEISYLMTRAITEKTSGNDLLDVTARDILYGYPELTELKVRRAEKMGYKLDRSHEGIVVLALNKQNHRTRKFRAGEAELVRNRTSQVIGYPILLSNEDRFLFMLLPAEAIDSQPLVRHLSDLIYELHKNDSQTCFYAGVGEPRVNVGEFRASLEEAHTIAKIMSLGGYDNDVLTFKDMIPQLMLYEMRGTDMAHRADEVLFAEIDRYDAVHETNLMGILRTYLQENSNVSATAKRLYMHRNTLMYRLKKIEELAGVDLGNPESRFKMMMGLYLRDLSQKQEKHA